MPANTRYGGKLSDSDIADIRVRLGSPSVIGGTNHNLLSATHADTASAAASQGALIAADSASKWAALPIGASGRYLRSDGASPGWAAIIGAEVSGLGAEPNLNFGSVAAEGTSGCFVRVNATVRLYDATTGPCAITLSGTSAVGLAGCAARRDHIHSAPATVPTNLGTANTEGSSACFARADHVHEAFSATGPCAITPDAASAVGTSGCAARRDHIHGADTGSAANLGTSNSEGTSACFARADHVHEAFSTTGPCAIVPDAASAVGTSGCAIRRDHVHGIDAGSPTTSLHQSSTNAEGSGNEFARATHTHAILSASSPGAAASLLATSTNGGIVLRRLGIGNTTEPATDGMAHWSNGTLQVRTQINSDGGFRFQTQTDGNPTHVRAIPPGTTASINRASFQAFFTDLVADGTNWASVEINADMGVNNPGVGWFRTDANGTCSIRPVALTSGETLTNGIYINTNGGVFIGDTANANITQGLTINQGANDDQILALKSSDVAHGITNTTETDTYARFIKASPTNGGLAISGFSSSIIGAHIQGLATVDDTTKSTLAQAYNVITSYKKVGAGADAVGANANLLSIDNSGTTRFIFDADGDFHADAGVAASSYDAHDDAALVRALELERNPAGLVRSRFDEWVRYNRADLQAAGIATFNDGPDGDGSIFLNYTALARLHSGALWQLYTRLRTLESQLTERTGSRFGLGISGSMLMG